MPVKRLLCAAALLFAGVLSQICSAQHLLFKSGFEPNTALGPLGGQTGGYTQPLTGTDTSTGFSWNSFPFGATIGVHDNGESDPLSNHFFNSIQTVTGHNGTSTQALFLDITGYTDFTCCPQAPLLMTPSSSTPIQQIYVSYWVLLPSSLATQLQNVSSGYGYEQTYWKSNDDYREKINLDRSANSSVLHAGISADALGKAQSIGNGCPYTDPITGASDNDCNWFFYQTDNTEYPFPIGQWVRVEYFIRRLHGPGGRFSAAIDGHIIGDYEYWGTSYGIDNEEIADLGIANLYSPYFPMSQTLDDLEIWDDMPCGSFPCATHAGGVPPVFESYQGVVGAVGVSFSFQPVITNSPTSFHIDGYGGTSLPPGLNYNTTTGLISGTPTSAGTYKIYDNAYNSAGQGVQTIEFQINSSLQAPVIKTFASYPTTVANGSPSTLYWNVLGAGTVTLSINQGVGTITGSSGTKVVNPTATTTYTLTATNGAGSATASTTVTASGGGGGSAPTITSFTATPSSISSGNSSTLAWNTSGATSLSIDQGIGTVTGTTSKVVNPSSTTTYTLTATNSYGSVAKSATITVGSLPTISSFTASPSTIASGDSSTLSWSCTGATSLSIDQGVGTVTGLSSAVVSPSNSTTYTMTATNSMGSVTRSVTVSVSTQSKARSALIIEP